MSRRQHFQVFSTVALTAIACALPAIGYWATQLKFGTTFVEKWLPGDDAARTQYRAFRDRFGDDQFLLIGWSDSDLTDGRLQQFTQQLQTLSTQRPELEIVSVDNSAKLLAELEHNGVPRDEAIRRLRGFALGRDGQCFLTVKLNQAPVEQRTDLIEQVRRIALEILQEDIESLVLAGEPYQVHMIDRSSREAMQYLVLPSSLLALIIAWRCLRDLRLTCMVFAFAGVGQLLGMATVAFFLGEMIAVLVVLPTLVFMLTLSATIHLTNYFIDCGGERSRFAGIEALRLGAQPCVLATLTTVFGFASLAVSQLAPVWQFGSLSALALVLSSSITLSCFPAATRLATRWLKRSVSSLSSGELAVELVDADHVHLPPDNAWTRSLSALTSRFATLVTLLGLGLLGWAIVGLSRLQTSTEFDDMFAARSEAVRSLNWVRKNIGPINALEFLVRTEVAGAEAPQPQFLDGPPAPAADILLELDLVESLQRGLASAEIVDSSLSALTFLPEPPSGTGLRSTIRRAVFRKHTLESIDLFRKQGLLSNSEQGRTWRVTVRVRGLRGDNYRDLRGQLLERVEQCITDFEAEHPYYRATYELTGLRTVVEKAHYALIHDLATSFAAAFLLITPVMMLIVRGVVSGLVLMIPNILPVALVFGGMGWAGIKLDVASILTASVALGIAVDDTLHFVSWYFRGRRSALSAPEAAHQAIAACSRPMLQTTIICTAAMAPFFFSDFLPTSKFALLMILILGAAIVGDLLLLPAVLQSPLGSWIGKKRSLETTSLRHGE